MNEQHPPAGWYPQGNEERYWDGVAWTEQRRPPGGVQYQRPVAYAQPAPKKSHTLRNVLLIAAGLLVLVVGGCTAVVVVAAGDAVNDAVEADKEPGGPDNPLEITEGEAFEVSDFKYATGWTVTKDFGLVGVEGLKVTNERDDKDSAIVEIKFWSGTEVLAVVDCSTEPIAVGTTTRLNCGSGDNFPKDYDKITINDTF